MVLKRVADEGLDCTFCRRANQCPAERRLRRATGLGTNYAISQEAATNRVDRSGRQLTSVSCIIQIWPVRSATLNTSRSWATDSRDQLGFSKFIMERCEPWK